MSKSEEQKLIDICFELVLMSSNKGNDRNGIPYDMTKWSKEKKAEWVATQLRDCGYNTVPCGASYGVLLPSEPEVRKIKRSKTTVNICSKKKERKKLIDVKVNDTVYSRIKEETTIENPCIKELKVTDVTDTDIFAKGFYADGISHVISKEDVFKSFLDCLVDYREELIVNRRTTHDEFFRKILCVDSIGIKTPGFVNAIDGDKFRENLFGK